MKTIGILQPGYLPWIGFFDQIQKCDVFVIYDDVQFDKNGWRNRNKIKTATGEQWLTVPVYHKGRSGQLVRDVKINETEDWRTKHVKAITQSYSKAKFFKKYSAQMFNIMQEPNDSLLSLDMRLIHYFVTELGIRTPIVHSSVLKISGEPVERLIKIIKGMNGDRFIEGSAGRNYIDDKQFLDSGISIEYHDYTHPTYQQLYGEFLPYMSIIDLLFNCGPTSLDILRSK